MIGEGGGSVSGQKICRFVISSSTYQTFAFNSKAETSANSACFSKESFNASYIAGCG